MNIVAAGMAEDGEIDLIDFSTMMRIQKISHSLLATFEDFQIYGNLDDILEETEDELKQ